MVTGDDKLDFFLRHWEQFEEWAPLRRSAVIALDEALTTAVDQLHVDSEVPAAEVQRGNPRICRLRLDNQIPDAWIELQWNKGGLFEGSWPTVVVVWHKGRGDMAIRAAVQESVREPAVREGFTKASANGWWVWKRELRPEGEPLDLEEYAHAVVDMFRSTWLTMHGPIERAVAEAKSLRE